MGFGQAAEQLSQVLYAFCCVDFVLWGKNNQMQTYNIDIPHTNTISSQTLHISKKESFKIY